MIKTKIKTNTLPKFIGLLIILSGAITLAILIRPVNFLILQVVLLSGIVVFYLLYKDMTNFVMVWLFTLLFSSFLRTSPGINLPQVSPDRVLWLSLLAYYLFMTITAQVPRSRRLTESLMFILTALAILSIIKTYGLSLSRSSLDAYSALFNIYIAPFSVFLIAKDFIYEERQIRKLFTFFSIILLYLTLTAIFENFKLTSFIFPKEIMNPLLGIHYERARGPFLQAAVNGTVICMLSVTNLYMAINTKLPFKMFFVVIAFLSPLAVLFTYTRAPWFAMIISFSFIFFINHRFRRYIVILILIGVTIMVPLHAKIVDIESIASRGSSLTPIYDRINLYHTYLAMIKERPIFGFGFANFYNYSHEYFSRRRGYNVYNTSIPAIHDTFVGVLVELGIFGFLVFLAIITGIFIKALRLFRDSEKDSFRSTGMAVVFLGVSITYILNALCIDMKYHQFQNVIFYLIAGIMVGLRYRREQDAKSFK